MFSESLKKLFLKVPTLYRHIFLKKFDKTSLKYYYKIMKVLAENRKAKFDYNILEKFEAGMVLIGQEVKAIKAGRMSLRGSYVVFKGSAQDGRFPEPYLVGTNVPPYQPKNALPDYDPERARKLLLNKAEIKHLLGKTKEKGLTLIPLKVYTKYAKIKLEFGIAKGKKKSDKREQIKKRDTDRIIRRELKTRG